MNTNEFLVLLNENPNSDLIFELELGNEIPKGWHITEIKKIHIDSVDCGGNLHEYNETVVQLLSSGSCGSGKTHMKALKAAKIFNTVIDKQDLDLATNIRFEYGDQQRPTSVYDVKDFVLAKGKLILSLQVQPTVCKPAMLTGRERISLKCC